MRCALLKCAGMSLRLVGQAGALPERTPRHSTRVGRNTVETDDMRPVGVHEVDSTAKTKREREPAPVRRPRDVAVAVLGVNMRRQAPQPAAVADLVKGAAAATVAAKETATVA